MEIRFLPHYKAVFKGDMRDDRGSQHVYEVRPRRDKRGVDLIAGALPFGKLWYGKSNAINNAIYYAKFYSRSHDALIRVYDQTRNVIEIHEHLAISKSRRFPFCGLAPEQPLSGCPTRSPIFRDYSPERIG